MYKRTPMTKYRNAYARIQYGYEFWIDEMNSDEASAYLHHSAQLIAIQMLATDDLDISEDEFDEVNSWIIERRDEKCLSTPAITLSYTKAGTSGAL